MISFQRMEFQCKPTPGMSDHHNCLKQFAKNLLLWNLTALAAISCPLHMNSCQPELVITQFPSPSIPPPRHATKRGKTPWNLFAVDNCVGHQWWHQQYQRDKLSVIFSYSLTLPWEAYTLRRGLNEVFRCWRSLHEVRSPSSLVGCCLGGRVNGFAKSWVWSCLLCTDLYHHHTWKVPSLQAQKLPLFLVLTVGLKKQE